MPLEIGQVEPSRFSTACPATCMFQAAEANHFLDSFINTLGPTKRASPAKLLSPLPSYLRKYRASPPAKKPDQSCAESAAPIPRVESRSHSVPGRGRVTSGS